MDLVDIWKVVRYQPKVPFGMGTNSLSEVEVRVIYFELPCLNKVNYVMYLKAVDLLNDWMSRLGIEPRSALGTLR